MYQNYDNEQNNQRNEYDTIPNTANVQDGPVETKRKGSHGVLKGLAVAFGFIVVAGGTFGGVYAVNHFNDKTSSSAKEDIIQPGEANTEESSEKSSKDTTSAIIGTNTVSNTTVSDVSQVSTEVMPSIVAINSIIPQSGSFFGQPINQQAESVGSGIIIGQSGNMLFIVTNNHVVENATSVAVTFIDEEQVEATIKGTDSSNDLAVITVDMSKMKDSTKKAIRIATLGDSDKSKVGEMVIAIGNALGYGQSVTVGYLSAKNREVQTDDYTMKLLQTDAAINPGNSGGALLNASGQVIGINSVKYASTDVEGIGYAIPISYALPIINDLINYSDIPDAEKGYLGVRFSDLPTSYLDRYNMPEGIYITDVVKGSPASRAGLQLGDIITGIDGRNTTSVKAFQEYLSMKRGGTEVLITFERVGNSGYEEKKVKITLGNRGDYSSSQDNSQNKNSQGTP